MEAADAVIDNNIKIVTDTSQGFFWSILYGFIFNIMIEYKTLIRSIIQ